MITVASSTQTIVIFQKFPKGIDKNDWNLFWHLHRENFEIWMWSVDSFMMNEQHWSRWWRQEKSSTSVYTSWKALDSAVSPFPLISCYEDPDSKTISSIHFSFPLFLSPFLSPVLKTHFLSLNLKNKKKIHRPFKYFCLSVVSIANNNY